MKEYIKFYKTKKEYYASITDDFDDTYNFRIRPLVGKVRYVSNKTDEPVVWKSDGITISNNIAKNALEISNDDVPTHIKKSFTYYLTVRDGRRYSVDGDAFFELM